MMELDTQSVLIGALLIEDKLAPYALPELSIECFRQDLRPTFAAVQGFWTSTGKLDAVQIIARYPAEKQTVLSCVQLCESECVRLTRERVEEWTRTILESAAKDRFQQLAICDEEQRPQTVNDNPTMTDVATLLEDKKLSLMCSTSGMEAEDPSEGMELTFLDYNGKNPDTLLRITPALVDGTPIIKVETQSLNQQ